MQLERQQAERSELQVVADPITVGPNKTINVDLAKLTAPSNVYDADFAWVEHRPGAAVSLFFGKASRDDDNELRTRLELRYPPETFVNHFWRNSREFHERVRAFVGPWPKDTDRDAIDPTRWTAAKDHSEWVGFEAMAHSGTEATLDFYLLPALGIARFQRNQGSGGLRVVPVVRIHMTVFELLRLLDGARSVVEAIEGYLSKLEVFSGEEVKR
jgi:hypothetical protein